MPPYKLINKTILIISPEKWGDNFLSKHHYANELSKHNNVFFLNSTPNPSLSKTIAVNKINSNLQVISYNKKIKGLLKLPSFLIDLQFKPIIKQLLNIIESPLDIVWDFDQVRFQNCKHFKANINIFHPVDIMKQIPSTIKSRKSNLCDLTLYLSNEIVKDIKSSKPKFFINHGISEDFFFDATNNLTYNSNSDIKVGYVGNIQSKFLDWDTLKTIITNNTGIHFSIIGPYENSNLGGNNKKIDIDFLKSQQNVTLTGPKTKAELIKTLPTFDAFLICYDTINYKAEVSNSHKLLEYCSTGKAIISNHISTYESIPNILEMVDKNIDLPEKFKTVISNLESYNSIEKAKYKISFAKQNTYKNHLLEIENIISNLND